MKKWIDETLKNCIDKFNIYEYPKYYPYKALANSVKTKDGVKHSIILKMAIPLEEDFECFDIDKSTEYRFENIFEIEKDDPKEAVREFKILVNDFFNSMNGYEYM